MICRLLTTRSFGNVLQILVVCTETTRRTVTAHEYHCGVIGLRHTDKDTAHGHGARITKHSFLNRRHWRAYS